MFRWLKLSINGRPLWVEVNGETERLSGLLRSLSIVGPKADCNTGRCAACTVLVGDSPVRSCAVKSEECAGKDVTTAERLDDGPNVHPMLAAFRNHGVPACTTCMPGAVLAAVAYAAKDRELTEDDVRGALSRTCAIANLPTISLSRSLMEQGPCTRNNHASPLSAHLPSVTPRGKSRQGNNFGSCPRYKRRGRRIAAVPAPCPRADSLAQPRDPASALLAILVGYLRDGLCASIVQYQ
jgi:aerobic-type carbon monoxide dehydrogenase small subunit (CoxS/CutS family)